MNTKSTFRPQRLVRVARGVAAAGALLAAQWAQAVNDLPGGPSVNQINLHEPATRIAAEQMSLHNIMLVICLVIFVAVCGVMLRPD